MAFVNSSTIGVDFNSSSTTALFALGTEVLGSGASEWTYVFATAAITTGQVCGIYPTGTAILVGTALMGGAGPAGTTGLLNFGVAQTAIAAGSFGWLARRGMGMYVQCSGTCAPVSLGIADTSGALAPQSAITAGSSCAGIFITTSASTATLSVQGIATLSWPRGVVGTVPVS